MKKLTYEAIGETDENIIYKRTKYLEGGVLEDTIRIPKEFKLINESSRILSQRKKF